MKLESSYCNTLRRSCCAMPVPPCKSDVSCFCSFQTQLNRDCDVVRPPEPLVDLGYEPFVVSCLVMSTMATNIALGSEI
jgi:hypothetical protein